MTMRVLSFNLIIEANHNICCLGQRPNNDDLAAIKASDAVIMPQGCKKELYLMAHENCENVFPNYDVFYDYQDKIGQYNLFMHHNVAIPKTTVFKNIKFFNGTKLDIDFTKKFVFKFSWGGEGNNVFLIQSENDLHKALELAIEYEKQGKQGFLFQEYIPTGGRSLRIVVIGDQYIPYWRVTENPNDFYSNISKGATIDYYSFPLLCESAITALQGFCKKTGINLAGFDFLFRTDEENPTALFLEINYSFRTKGLGGYDNYLKLLSKSIRDWLASIN